VRAAAVIANDERVHAPEIRLPHLTPRVFINKIVSSNHFQIGFSIVRCQIFASLRMQQKKGLRSLIWRTVVSV